MSDDYYRLLGVDRQVSQEALRRAFRDQLKNVHPDLNPTDPLACERTRRILEAYRTLSNPLTRKKHNASLTQPAALFKLQPAPDRPFLHPVVGWILSVSLFIMVGLCSALITGIITDDRHHSIRIPLTGAEPRHPSSRSPYVGVSPQAPSRALPLHPAGW